MTAPGSSPPSSPYPSPPSIPPESAYASPGGYPSGKPQHLGLAYGLTLAEGILALIVGGLVLLFALFFSSLGVAFGEFPGFPMRWIGGAFALFAAVPVVVGVLLVVAAFGLQQGKQSMWTMAVVLHAIVIVVSLPAMLGAIIPLALSGGALWALFQPGVRAYMRG